MFLFTVHIIINKSEDFNFYNDVINLIKGGSKIFNIFIFLEKNYIEHENSVCHSYSPTCTISIVIEVTLYYIIIHYQKFLLYNLYL